MDAFLNGKILPEEHAVVSVLDRGFLYGDGLFESVRVHSGRLFRWPEHFERLVHGAAYLRLKIPFAGAELRNAAEALIERNQILEGVLRLTLSRGCGVRGYSPRGADRPVVAMTLHPLEPAPSAPPGWKVSAASARVAAGDPLATVKSCNKLLHVLARAEAEERGNQEALLLNTRDEVVEAASSNLFWLEGSTICTTPVAVGVLPGVTRAFVLELCQDLRLEHREKVIGLPELKASSGAFLTMSTVGIVTVTHVDDHPLAESPLVGTLAQAYRTQVERELHNSQR